MAKADDIKARIKPSDIISKYVQLKPGWWIREVQSSLSIPR